MRILLAAAFRRLNSIKQFQQLGCLKNVVSSIAVLSACAPIVTNKVSHLRLYLYDWWLYSMLSADKNLFTPATKCPPSIHPIDFVCVVFVKKIFWQMYRIHEVVNNKNVLISTTYSVFLYFQGTLRGKLMRK